MGQIHPTVIDFESYYDAEYNLNKMTPEEYIRDPRFQLMGCSVQPPGKRAKYVTGKTHGEIVEKLRKIKWGNLLCIAHNNIGFDSLVLTHHVGVRPAYWACTLSMARQIHGPRGNSLEALAEKYGLQRKRKEVLTNVKGKRLEDLTSEESTALGHYAEVDAEICHALFYLMKPKIHPRDLRMIHWFVRMFAEPRIKLDGNAYRQWVDKMVEAKQTLLDNLGLDQKQLRSNPKFAGLLEEMGVEVPTKISPTTGREAYAFAKTDRGMMDLLEHPDDRVRALVEARLKTKTSIEQTRAERFVGIAQRGKLPVPLLYGVTHTLRAAGSGKINLQNLGKGKKPNDSTLEGTLLSTPNGLRTLQALRDEKEQGDRRITLTNEGDVFQTKEVHQFNLRDGIMAPPGYKLVVIDSSNIELRVAHTIAGQMDTVQKLENGEDLYCWFAGDIYGYEVVKGTHDKERQHGKVGMLQLQYQSGDKSFQKAAWVMGGLELTPVDAKQTVDLYRSRFYKLPEFWRTCEEAIKAMYRGQELTLDRWGLVSTGKNCLYLPRGRVLHYDNLRREYDEEWGGWQWVYDDRRTKAPKKLYGGAMTENICQAVAGIIVMDQCVDIEAYIMRNRDPNEGVVLTVHDEAVSVVREDRAQGVLDKAMEIMSTRPSWWPQLPLAAEGDIAKRYGSAK